MKKIDNKMLKIIKVKIDELIFFLINDLNYIDKY